MKADRAQYVCVFVERRDHHCGNDLVRFMLPRSEEEETIQQVHNNDNTKVDLTYETKEQPSSKKIQTDKYNQSVTDRLIS